MAETGKADAPSRNQIPSRKKGSAHLALGKAGEDAAQAHLAANGFSLLARNWRPEGHERSLELDLVGFIKSTVVFVEVKARAEKTAREQPPALANFSPAKRRNMVRAARAFLSEHELWDSPCRFDLICVTFTPGTGPQLEHYRDVIELGQTLDSGDTAWQPW